MRMELKGGSWECFSGVKEIGKTQKSPIIICRPQGDPKGAYFIFHEDKVIVEKPQLLNFIDNGSVWVMKRK